MNTVAKSMLTLCAFLFLCMALAACGNRQTPVMQPPTDKPVLDADAPAPTLVPSDAPSDTPIPPTATQTPLPPTNTPMPTATSPPSTEAPPQSPIDRLVAVRNPANGESLFYTFQDAANYACSNCHNPESEKALVGPGMLNIKDRAALRLPGQSAAEYLYQSIINTNDYIVEGYEAGVMPQNWADIYSDLQIFDIVAYLMTLEGRSDINDPDPTTEAAAADESM